MTESVRILICFLTTVLLAATQPVEVGYLCLAVGFALMTAAYLGEVKRATGARPL